ncbi:MAG: universal stress protein [Chloracidobacterium sp.]|nr:universal stress protein [Chloracidobacterium sp.]
MKILIATDGSSFSTAAVEMAAQLLPNRSDTQVKLISVYEKLGPMVTEPFGVSIEHYREAENAERKLAEEAVISSSDKLRASFPDEIYDRDRGGTRSIVAYHRGDSGRMAGRYDRCGFARLWFLGTQPAWFGLRRSCSSGTLYGAGR